MGKRHKHVEKESSAKGQKKKKTKINKGKMYKIEGNKITKKRSCPKCGGGVFLAEHKDRTSCGKCGYSEKK